MDIAAIAKQVNALAVGRDIGGLQRLRSELRRFKRLRPTALFTAQSTYSDYAFHSGGRSELQFNIGDEDFHGSAGLRHGVAFSFQRSQSLPDIDVLLPKVARFNEFMRVYPDAFGECQMWYYADGKRSDAFTPVSINPALCREGVFVFLGRWSSAEEFQIDDILDSFDLLMPLYAYVEGNQSGFPAQHLELPKSQPVFRPGCTVKKSSTSVSRAKRTLDVSLRHNDLQFALHTFLEQRYGANCVGSEQDSGAGTRIDVVVKLGDARTYFELKTDMSARACVRAGLAQLLEYSYWPRTLRARELVIVGESALDSDTREFLWRLRTEFEIPLRYAQFDLATGTLVEE